MYIQFKVIRLYLPRFRHLREDNDLKQKEVASVLGIDQRVYSNYETGKREIPVHLLVRLADYYNGLYPQPNEYKHTILNKK